MSGGYFDYLNNTLLCQMESIKENYAGYSDVFHEELQSNVKDLFYDLINITTEYMHDIDYHISGDTIIHNQDNLVKDYIDKIKLLIEKY